MAQMDILIYVEDPGAANFVAGLPCAIRQRGLRVTMVANGKGAEQLKALNESFEPLLKTGDVAGLLGDI